MHPGRSVSLLPSRWILITHLGSLFRAAWISGPTEYLFLGPELQGSWAASCFPGRFSVNVSLPSNRPEQFAGPRGSLASLCPGASELAGRFAPSSCCLSLAQAGLAWSPVTQPPSRLQCGCQSCPHLIALFIEHLSSVFPVCSLQPGAELCSLVRTWEGDKVCEPVSRTFHHTRPFFLSYLHVSTSRN